VNGESRINIETNVTNKEKVAYAIDRDRSKQANSLEIASVEAGRNIAAFLHHINRKNQNSVYDSRYTNNTGYILAENNATRTYYFEDRSEGFDLDRVLRVRSYEIRHYPNSRKHCVVNGKRGGSVTVSNAYDREIQRLGITLDKTNIPIIDERYRQLIDLSVSRTDFYSIDLTTCEISAKSYFVRLSPIRLKKSEERRLGTKDSVQPTFLFDRISYPLIDHSRKLSYQETVLFLGKNTFWESDDRRFRSARLLLVTDTQFYCVNSIEGGNDLNGNRKNQIIDIPGGSTIDIDRNRIYEAYIDGVGSYIRKPNGDSVYLRDTIGSEFSGLKIINPVKTAIKEFVEEVSHNSDINADEADDTLKLFEELTTTMLLTNEQALLFHNETCYVIVRISTEISALYNKTLDDLGYLKNIIMFDASKIQTIFSSPELYRNLFVDYAGVIAYLFNDTTPLSSDGVDDSEVFVLSEFFEDDSFFDDF
jgi:hypothetical protein